MKYFKVSPNQQDQGSGVVCLFQLPMNEFQMLVLVQLQRLDLTNTILSSLN